ncbi:hypothetical protein [Zavarzinella formosa]|uniref:hypothetical protein n=1 Tax=Zavarzinella formosa TaxID=360055 RepID=UPI0002EAD29F|nr:hypothetical protein [Zavarzinella formosa]
MGRFLMLAGILFSAGLLTAKEPAQPRHEPKPSFLANDQIKLGVDLNVGGAITYLSVAGRDDNIVNNWDWGRQIQMSHYAGPVPFVVGDKKPADHWKHLGWNPVQAGDDFRNPSKVWDSRNDGKEIYVKCAPMQWPLNNVPADCTFESWISLEGSTAKVRSKITLNREDKTFYPARMQELPAVYVNAPYHRLMTCKGEKPQTNEKLSQITYVPTRDQPWTSWFAGECWAALVNDDDFGLGVCHPGCHRFSGGFAGKPGPGGTHDSSTGYLAPNFVEHLDHHGEYEFTYFLIVGKLADIRTEALKRLPKPAIPSWTFTKDRQNWYYLNARDSGWPIQNGLAVELSKEDPQLISPTFCVPAADVPMFRLAAAFKGKEPKAQLFWATHEKPGFAEARSLTFLLNPDGEYRDYAIKLAGHPEWKGTITDLRFDPTPSGAERTSIKIKSMALGK